jgi:uncharacterized protein YndB with AHSA1/START domain
MSRHTVTAASTDRIERQIRLEHPRSRVWRALTDYREFNRWFGVELTQPFEPGSRLTAKVNQGGRVLAMDIVVERMEPERLFSWRWHPGALAPPEELAGQPMTLVVFELKDVPGGTLLTVVETGFDRIPLARRAKSFAENSEGWTEQMKNIETWLDRTA